MSVLESMARAGYERALMAPIPGLLDPKEFNPNDEMHRWENQSDELRLLWREIASTMRDIMLAARAASL